MVSPQMCRRLKLILLDVDGVLTDGSIWIADGGVEIKRFHVRDGAAIKWWQNAGGKVGIVSGRKCRAVEVRAKELGIPIICQGIREKLPVVQQILDKLSLQFDEVCYIGDDLPDLPVIRRAGCGVTVADAPLEVQAAADYITTAAGGHGAVRETIELILKSQGEWETLFRREKAA